MKRTGLLAGFILIIIFTSGPHYQQAEGEEKRSIISAYDEVFEKTVITLRRRNTEEVSLLSARRYKTGYQYAVIRTDSLKKSGSYQAVFDTLNIYFPSSPASLVYYEELISTGAGSGNLLLIKNKLDEIRDRPLTPYEEYARGIIMNLRGNIDSALTLFSGILKNHPDFAIVYLRYANALKDKGRYDEAKKALSTFFSTDNDDSYLHAEGVLLQGTIAFLEGNYDQALRYYQQAGALAESLYDIYTQSRALINQGLVQDMYGEYDLARDLINRGIEGAKRLKDPELLAYGYSELGVSYSFTSDYPDALGYYQEAINIYQRTGNNLRLSYLYANRGNLQNAMGNYAGALASYREGVKSSGDAPRPMIQNLTGMADVYVNAGNYSQALKHYHEARQLARKINDKDLLSSIEIGSGSFKLNLGAYETAEKHFMRAMALTDVKSNPLQAADIYDKLALVKSGLGKTDSAKILLQLAISTAKRYQDIILHAAAVMHLAAIYKDEGEYTKALEILEGIKKSLAAEQYPQQYAEAVITKAEILFEAGKTTEALSQLEESDPARLIKENAYLTLYFHSVKTRVLTELGMKEAAQKESAAGIEYYEKTTQSLISGSHDIPGLTKLAAGLYDAQIQLLNEMGMYKKAFSYIERKNGGNAYRNVISLTLSKKVTDQQKIDELYSLAWGAESGVYSQEERDSVRYLYHSLLNSLSLKKPLTTRMLSIEEMQSDLEENE
ncbi:MAG: tetratricopeptide repeat protein, partial [Ignavibacteriaceae bacterium]|nr:tetratricopeptide repeat protein [Ignavibacteriaceae bacterium]